MKNTELRFMDLNIDIEYEVDFSVDPVEITDRYEDNEDDNDNDGEALVLEDLITIDEASEIALEKEVWRRNNH